MSSNLRIDEDHDQAQGPTGSRVPHGRADMQCTSGFFARHGAYEDKRRLQSLMDRCEMKRNEIDSCNCVTSRKSMLRIVRHSLMTCVGKSPCRLQASCPRAQSRKAISTPCSNRAEPARAKFPSKAVNAPNNPNPLWHQQTDAKNRAPLSSARLKGKQTFRSSYLRS